MKSFGTIGETETKAAARGRGDMAKPSGRNARTEVDVEGCQFYCAAMRGFFSTFAAAPAANPRVFLPEENGGDGAAR